MSDLDKLLKLYLLQEIGEGTSLDDVYTNKQNLFNNELYDNGEKIANVNENDVDLLTKHFLQDYDYAVKLLNRKFSTLKFQKNKKMWNVKQIQINASLMKLKRY